MTHAFTWADFYLICFAVGFCFSFLSFLMGGARGGHFHLPHFHGQVGAGHLPSSHAAHQSADISPFNLITLTAFLAWFGGLDICSRATQRSGLDWDCWPRL